MMFKSEIQAALSNIVCCTLSEIEEHLYQQHQLIQ
jgi:hypothetical protein